MADLEQMLMREPYRRAIAQRPCPTCRKPLTKPEPSAFFLCKTCGWTDDPDDRKKLYGAKP